MSLRTVAESELPPEVCPQPPRWPPLDDLVANPPPGRKRTRFRLSLARDEQGNYWEPSPHQGGRCVWPGCHHPRDDLRVDVEQDRDLGIPLCMVHALDVHRIVAMSFSAQGNGIVVDRHGRTRTPNDSPDGWIYYVRSGEKIKIGHTTRLKQRIRAYPPDTIILAVHRGSKDDEKQLHTRFQTYRVAGREWYERSDVLLAHIADMTRRYGPPPSDLHPKRVSTGRAPVRLRARTWR